MQINHLRSKNRCGGFFRRFRAAVSFFTLWSYVCTQLVYAAPEVRPVREQVSIPQELGTVIETTSGHPSIFIIQDAHGHYEAQKTTEALLDFLKDHQNLAALFIEGGAGRLDPSRMRFFKEEPLNLKSADVLMREAEAGGAERFLLRNDSVSAYGLESMPLYLLNVQRFQEVFSRKNQTDAALDAFFSGLQKEATKVFSKELFESFKLWAAYEDGRAEPGIFLDHLALRAPKALSLDLSDPRAQLEWPMLVRYFQLKKREPLPDAARVKLERKKLIVWAESRHLGRNLLDVLDLLDGSGRLPPALDRRAFWETFYRQASPLGFRFEDYPALALWEGAKILEQEIDAQQLMKEIERLRTAVFEKLAVKDEEKNLLRRFSGYLTLKKIFSVSMTREEYQDWVRAAPGGLPDGLPADLKPAYDKAMDFYRIAFERDRVMAGELTRFQLPEGRTAAVIAGGFHTRGLCDFLRRKEISYAVITPRIGVIEGTRKYTDAMTGKTRKIDFGASTVRMPTWDMPQEGLPANILAARAGLLAQIRAAGEKEGGHWTGRGMPRSEMRAKSETAEHMLPDFRRKMLPLALKVQDRYYVRIPDRPGVKYEQDPLEKEPVILKEDAGARPRSIRMVENTLKFLQDSVHIKHQATLDWLKQNVFIIGVSLPTMLFYEDSTHDDFDKSVQISYRRNALIFSMSFLNALNPDSPVDQAMLGLYLMRAADLMRAYHNEVDQLTYESENQGLMPVIFGDIYKRLQEKNQRYSWNEHLKIFDPVTGPAQKRITQNELSKRIEALKSMERKNKQDQAGAIEEKQAALMAQTDRIVAIYDDSRWHDVRVEGKDSSEIDPDRLYEIYDKMEKEAAEKRVEMMVPQIKTLEGRIDADDFSAAFYEELGLVNPKVRNDEIRAQISELRRSAPQMTQAREHVVSLIDSLAEIAFYYQSSPDLAIQMKAEKIYDRIIELQKALQKIDMVGIFPINVQIEALYLQLRRGKIRDFVLEFQRLLKTEYVPWAFRRSQRTNQGIYYEPDGNLKVGWGRLLNWSDSALPDICMKLQVLAASYPKNSSEARYLLKIEEKIKDVWWQVLKANTFQAVDFRMPGPEKTVRPLLVPAKEKESDTSTAVPKEGRLQSMDEPYRIFYGFYWQRRIQPGQGKVENPETIQFRVTAYRRTADGGQSPAGYIDIIMRRNPDGRTYEAAVDPEGTQWAGSFGWTEQNPGMMVHLSDNAEVEGLRSALFQLAETLVESSGGGTKIDISRMLAQDFKQPSAPLRKVSQKTMAWTAGGPKAKKVELWKRRSGYLGITVSALGRRYKVVEMLDRVGNGRVYRAHALDPAAENQDLAVKFFSDPGPRARELRQRQARHESKAQKLAGKNNRNAAVAKHYGFGINEKEKYAVLAMEYVKGETLPQWAGRHPSADRLALAEKILKAAGSFAPQIKHLDLKPSNVLVTEDGSVKIIDFTLAQIGNDPAPFADPKEIRGTLHYMAPEMFKKGVGPYDSRTDVYSLAVTLFELAVREKLFLNETPLDAVLNRDKNIPEEKLERLLPPEWAAAAPVLRQALNPDPEQRYADINVMLEAWRRALAPQRSEMRTLRAEDLGGTEFGYGEGRYQVTRLIGAGGMSFLYKARRISGNGPEKMALKTMRFPDPQPLENEAQALLAVRGQSEVPEESVPEVYGKFEIGGLPVLALEYVEGETLSAWRQTRPPEETLDAAGKVLAAAAAVSKSTVQHRDYKPENILMAENKAKIIDFGLAKILPEVPAPTDGNYVGTPLYASPETMSGEKTTLASDVYSLGAILYWLAAGRPPFQGSPSEIFYQKLRGITRQTIEARFRTMNLTAWLPFAGLVAEALDRDPAKRPQDAEKFLAEFEEIRSAQASAAPVFQTAGRRRFITGGLIHQANGKRIYRAVEEGRGLPAIIKEFPQDSETLALNEYRRLLQARGPQQNANPNVPAVYGYGETGRPARFFMASELIEGEILYEWRRGKTAEEILPAARQMLAAFKSVHDHGVIHGDIKNNNIMVTPGGKVKPIDFELARTPEDNEIMGYTPGFAAPEVYEGPSIYFESDVYSLGVNLFWFLTGTPLFNGSNTRVLMDQTINARFNKEEIERRLSAAGADFWLPFAPVLAKALARDRRDRYPNAGEMLKAFDAVNKRREFIALLERINGPWLRQEGLYNDHIAFEFENGRPTEEKIYGWDDSHFNEKLRLLGEIARDRINHPDVYPPISEEDMKWLQDNGLFARSEMRGEGQTRIVHNAKELKRLLLERYTAGTDAEPRETLNIWDEDFAARLKPMLDEAETIRFRRGLSRSEMRSDALYVRAGKNRYRTTRFAGSGVTADFFEGVDLRTNRRVGIKVYRSYYETNRRVGVRVPEDPAISRLYDEIIPRKEFEMMQKARGKNPANRAVPYVLDLGKTLSFERKDSRPALVMQYIPGRPLSSLDTEVMEAGQRYQIALSVLEAAADMHDNGVVHKDLGAQNLLLDEENNAAIVDFVNAQAAGEKLIAQEGYRLAGPESETENTVAHPSYDVYQLGAFVFRLAAGYSLLHDLSLPQFQNSAREVFDAARLKKKLEDYGAREWLGAVPVIAKAMKPNPRDRYQNAAEMLSDLYAAQLHRFWHPLYYGQSTGASLRSEVRTVNGYELKEKYGGKYDPRVFIYKNGIGLFDRAEKEKVAAEPVSGRVFRLPGGQKTKGIIKMRLYSADAEDVLREADVLEQIHKDGIVPGIPVLKHIGMMEKGGVWVELEGISGGKRFDDYSFSDDKDLLTALLKAARILKQAHNRGLLNNDIKPANLLINGAKEVLFNDWDIASVPQTVVTRNTPGYAALIPQTWEPDDEKPRKQTDDFKNPDTDVFSFIITVLELLARQASKNPEKADDLIPGYWNMIFKPFSADLKAAAHEHVKETLLSMGRWEAGLQLPRESWPKDIDRVIERLENDIAAVSRSEVRSEGPVVLAVAEKMTAKILAPGEMREFFGRLFPPAEASEPENFAASSQGAAEIYAKLFKTGASAVLPASLLSRLPEAAQEAYLEAMIQGFIQSGRPARPSVYFAGEGAAGLKGALFTREIFKKYPSAQKIFDVVLQDEIHTAGRRGKDAISVSMTTAPEDLKAVYHFPAFLTDPDASPETDAVSAFKYLHGLTQLQLLAASQLKRQLGDVVHAAEYAKLMGEFLRKAGIEYSASQGGLIVPSAASLLADTLSKFIRSQELTTAAA